MGASWAKQKQKFRGGSSSNSNNSNDEETGERNRYGEAGTAGKGDEDQTEEPVSGMRDEDVLTLNTCGHAFHSRCLASWFLVERFDCPVCRMVYYTRPPSRPQSSAMMGVVGTYPFHVGSRGRVMGLG